jgi:hypothetical protein
MKDPVEGGTDTSECANYPWGCVCGVLLRLEPPWPRFLIENNRRMSSGIASKGEKRFPATKAFHTVRIQKWLLMHCLQAL